MELLTLDKFKELKKKLFDSKNNLDDYMSTEEEIVSYDLSNIPYEEWDGIKIIGSIDFSDTKANLDFHYVQFQSLCNLDSCNLRNIPVPELPLEWQEKCRNRTLTYTDLIDHIEVFEGIPVRYYLKDDNEIPNLSKIVGNHLISDIIKEHFDVFSHIKEKGNLESFNEYIDLEKPFETSFLQAVKDYARKKEIIRVRFYDENHREVYELPEWLHSMNLKIVPNYLTMEEIENHDIHNYIAKDGVEEFINLFNIDNIKRFEEENHLFLKNTYERMPYSNYLEIFGNYTYIHLSEEEIKNHFRPKQETYEEFCNYMAEYLNALRRNNYFSDYPDYDFLDGTFREKYPQLFVEKDAPLKIKEAFYKNQLTPNYINSHQEVIPYLLDKDLLKLIRLNQSERYTPLYKAKRDYTFAEKCIDKFDNNGLLSIYAQYGDKASEVEDIDSINTIEELEQKIRDYFYDQIVNHDYKYDHLKTNREFVLEHPDLFIDLSKVEGIEEKEKENIERSFHNHYLSFETIRKYPQLANLLKYKRIDLAFGMDGEYRGDNAINYIFFSSPFKKETEKEKDTNLLKIVGKEKFLDMCTRYGRFLEKMNRELGPNVENLSYEEIINRIDQIIVDKCRSGKINYFPQEVPEFLKEQKDLFLNEDAPEELSKKFYSTNNDLLSFSDLKQHPEWNKYLEGKSIKTALIRSCYKKEEMEKYFHTFGAEKGIQLGIRRPETIDKMISEGQVLLLKQWYDKTNQKFIPDIVIINNFSLDQADKFLSNGPTWSNLMKLKNFSYSEESREAMLKLAYTFGAFDNDTSGYKKTVELLTGLPRVIAKEKKGVIDHLRQLDSIKKENEHAEEYTSSSMKDYLLLKEILIQEGFAYDESKGVTDNVYVEQRDGSFKLNFNPQSYPKSTHIIRTMMEKDISSPIISPMKAHKLFGGFEMKYDKDFREFFLENLDAILESDDGPTYIASIQKQFQEIKTANSNRHLTLDLAISYVQSNKYENVEVGNEKAAEVSAIAGYTQEEFDVLQNIYNYGKTRIFSSIPRIAKEKNGYHYEMLRLNDPLAMAIGTLTNCCQEIGNAAEMCMEHSMVSNSGRIFVIKDVENNIVAQSWVWRNKDTLCFDNIEIPDRAFTRHEKDGVKRNEFTDQIYDIYKTAAEDLIEEDEKKYKEALEENKITKEDYQALKLNKVTVGLGYNDIAYSLKKHSTLDVGHVKKPMEFKAPVDLNRELYTSDSKTQYILEKQEKEENAYSQKEAPYFYSDDYEVYDENNFKEKELLQLQKLELVTTGNPENLISDIEDYSEETDLIQKISRNYGISRENTKVVLHPNFAIIYEDKGYEVDIADLFYNTKVGVEERNIEDKVAMQIHLALNQISDKREIRIDNLKDNQKEMYDKATAIGKELDKERGVNNGK